MKSYGELWRAMESCGELWRAMEIARAHSYGEQFCSMACNFSSKTKVQSNIFPTTGLETGTSELSKCKKG
jgi:hypothetical protein